MKKRVYTLLLALMLLLTACDLGGADSTTASTEQAGTTSAPTISDTPSSGTEPGKTEPDEPFIYTYYPDPMLPSADEIGKDYYFLCPQFDVDFTTGDRADTIHIPLISKTEIDPDSIEVTLPLENIPYTVAVSQWRHPEQMERWIYDCYQGCDWVEALAIRRLEAKPEEERTAEEQAKLDAYWAQQAENSKQFNALEWKDYPGSIQDFYGYQIMITFDYVDLPEDQRCAGEVLTYMDISWPGVSFRQECGEIRFSYQEIPVSDPFQGVFSMYTTAQLGVGGMPYGLANGSFFIEFTAEQDMVLTGISAIYGNPQITKIRLKIDGLDMIWDGKTPIPVPEGADVYMDVHYVDPALATVTVAGKHIWQMDYFCDGTARKTITSIRLVRYLDFCVYAAVYFDGVDVPAYYREFANELLGPAYFA